MLNLLPGVRHAYAVHFEQVLHIPFELHGHDGVVAVEYGTNSDPVATGHDLFAIGYDRQSFLGFPVMQCRLTYSGTGYRSLCGWIQIVTRSEVTGGEDRTVDVLPCLAPSDSPMCFVGYLPTFFDAPANPHHPDGRWLAETFLTQFDPRLPRVRAVAAVAWGYDLLGGHPRPLAPERLPLKAWNRRRSFLTQEYPRWTFAEVIDDGSGPGKPTSTGGTLH